MTPTDPNPGLAAESLLLGAVVAVLIGTGAILALVLRRGKRLRDAARSEPSADTETPDPWYEAGKRARAEDFDPTDTTDEGDEPGRPS